MKKPYDHVEVTKLLDKAEVCANNIRKINHAFQESIASKLKKIA